MNKQKYTKSEIKKILKRIARLMFPEYPKEESTLVSVTWEDKDFEVSYSHGEDAYRVNIFYQSGKVVLTITSYKKHHYFVDELLFEL